MTNSDERAKIDETAKYLFTASNKALIDFISGIFTISLDRETTEVVRVSTEYIAHNPRLSKHLPDIVLEIKEPDKRESKVHVEIQTNHDGMMDLRMVRYGYLIGVANASKEPDDIRVITIPHQVVIYLEENSRIGDHLTVKMIFPDESETNYTVPIFKLYEHSAPELKEKDLYLLLPLVLVKYRKRLEKICKKAQKSREELDEIVQEIITEIESITAISGRYEETGIIDERTKDIILSATKEMYTQLHQKYIRDKKSKQRVEGMIESVTQKVFQKGHMIGVEEGIEKGREAGMEEGKMLEARNIAQNLIKLGMEDEFIRKATGLALEEIQKLKN